jgi:hypothetical protein
MLNKFYPIAIALLLAACGGGDSSPSPSIITVPNSAPAPTPSPIPASSCVNPHNATYPSSYEGRFDIPKPKYMLSVNYDRGISFKDYSPGWIYNNPSMRIPNCSKEEYIKLMYVQSLDRLKSNGATMTWLYNYGPWDDANASQLTVDESNYHIPVNIVEFIVQEAAKRNIEVYYVWQFTTHDKNGKSITTLGEPLTPQKLTSLLNSHKAQMINNSKLAQRTGMKGVSADWNALHIVNLDEPNIKELYTTKYIEIIDSIRQHFNGEITWGQTGSIYSDPRIINKVDSIHVSVGGPLLTDTENATLTVEKVEQAITKQIKQMYEDYSCTAVSCTYIPANRQIPVFFEIAVQSRDNYWTEGWVEDGFCVAGKLSDGTRSDCIQNYYTTDFSVQAIGIEGAMRAITNQSYFKIGGINFHSSFWHSDTLVPSPEGFPNISQSIRGKPAEKIVKYWFTGT